MRNGPMALTDRQQRRALELLRATLYDLETGAMADNPETREAAKENIRRFLREVDDWLEEKFPWR